MQMLSPAEGQHTESQSPDNWGTECYWWHPRSEQTGIQTGPVVQHLDKHARDGPDAWTIPTLALKVNKHARRLKEAAMTAMFHITALLRGRMFVDQEITGIRSMKSAEWKGCVIFILKWSIHPSFLTVSADDRTLTFAISVIIHHYFFHHISFLNINK